MLGFATLPRPDPRDYRTTFDVARGFMRTPPVDLEGMARALGVQVDMHAVLDEGESGRLRRIPGRDGPSFEIEVNGAHSLNRRRFTLAHEIAHFLLHRDLMGAEIVDSTLYRSGLPEPIEYEANRMAAELVMPADLVRTAWRSGARAVMPLARAFKVSEEAMRIRLKQLGYQA